MKQLLIFLFCLSTLTGYSQACVELSDTVSNNNVTNITFNSARVNGVVPTWMSVVVALNLRYVRTGFTDTATASGSTTSALRLLTGLQPNTQYTYYYQTFCGTFYNNQSGRYTFTTATNTVQYTPMTAAGYQYKYLKVDSGALFTCGDTTLGRAPNVPGTIKMRCADSLFYYYNGRKWNPLAIDSFGIMAALNSKVDSVTVYSDTLLYWVNGISYGYVLPIGVTVDTTSLSNRINTKVESLYRSADSVYAVINGIPVFQYIDSTGGGGGSMVYPLAGLALSTGSAWGTSVTDNSTNWNTVINRVLYTDTATMLANYKHWAAGYTKNSDTSAMLTNYRHWLEGYLKGTDTAGLSFRINQKLNIADTASMLANYRNWIKSGSDLYSSNSGNVGIGQAPSYKLDVNGTINANGFLRSNGVLVAFGAGSNNFLYAGNGGDLIVTDNGSTNLVTIKQSGKVGIGTNVTPDSLLQIVGGGLHTDRGVRHENLPSGASTDSVVTVDGSGTLKKRNMASVGSVPTLQQVFDKESNYANLTTANTIDAGANLFEIYDGALNLYSRNNATLQATTTGTNSGLVTVSKTGQVYLQASTNGLSINSSVTIDTGKIQFLPSRGNIFIDSLLHSVTATDKMVVWDSATGKVTTRLIPSGGGGAVDTAVIATRDYAKKAADSLDNVNAVSLENPNTGDTLLRVISSSRFQVKSLVDDYGLLNTPNDSSVVQRVDTMVIATRDRVKQIADSAAIAHGGGTGGGNLYKDVTTQFAHINNIDSNYATTATAATTTTLTANSKYQQNFTGTTTQTIVLPNATTLIAGVSYYITNNSTGTLTVNKNGGTLLQTVAAGQTLSVTVTDISSSAGGWMYENSGTQITFKKVLAINALKIL